MVFKALSVVNKNSIVIPAAGILFLLVLPLITLFFPIELRDSVHRIYTAHVIAEHLIEGIEDAPSKVERYFDFVYNNIFPDMGESPIDKGALNTLVRGIGWCDQQAFVLNELCSYQNIEAGRLDLLTRHSVSLILIDSSVRLN